MLAQAFLDESRRLLSQSYLPRIARCLEGLSDDTVWWRANPESNSMANLLLHLSGNLRQWIVSGLGGVPDVRNRPQEFDARGQTTAADLLSALTTTVLEADRVLATLSPDALGEPRRIQGSDVTVFEAIYHAVEHFSMHTGQIILLTKMWKGDVGFYEVLEGTPRPTWSGG
jgi:uncharacterized damage-inducible protein DinB